MERFRSLGKESCKFIVTKESVYKRKEFNSHGFSLVPNMAAITLFWDTNVAAVTSCEKRMTQPISKQHGRFGEALLRNTKNRGSYRKDSFSLAFLGLEVCKI